MRGLQLDENLWLCEIESWELDGFRRNHLYISQTFPGAFLYDPIRTNGFAKAIKAHFVRDRSGFKDFELTELGEAMMNLQQNNSKSYSGYSGFRGDSAGHSGRPQGYFKK